MISRCSDKISFRHAKLGIRLSDILIQTLEIKITNYSTYDELLWVLKTTFRIIGSYLDFTFGETLKKLFEFHVGRNGY